MLKAGLCVELGERSTWQCVPLPISPCTHTGQCRNPRNGKCDAREEQRESVEVDAESSVLWQTLHHLRKIKNHDKANPISPRLAQARNIIENNEAPKIAAVSFPISRKQPQELARWHRW